MTIFKKTKKYVNDRWYIAYTCRGPVSTDDILNKPFLQKLDAISYMRKTFSRMELAECSDLFFRMKNKWYHTSKNNPEKLIEASKWLREKVRYQSPASPDLAYLLEQNKFLQDQVSELQAALIHANEGGIHLGRAIYAYLAGRISKEQLEAYTKGILAPAVVQSSEEEFFTDWHNNLDKAMQQIKAAEATRADEKAINSARKAYFTELLSDDKCLPDDTSEMELSSGEIVDIFDQVMDSDSDMELPADDSDTLMSSSMVKRWNEG